MHQRIRTLAALKSFFTKFVDEHTKVLADMDKAREKDTLRHFMSSNAAHLHVMTVYASESIRFTNFIDGEAVHDGVMLTDERKLEIVIEETQRRVNNLNMRITSRSTSISSNLDEDAERAFWIELHQALHAGY